MDGCRLRKELHNIGYIWPCACEIHESSYETSIAKKTISNSSESIEIFLVLSIGVDVV